MCIRDSYEDNHGMFEMADGHTLLRYLEAAYFGVVTWEIVPGTPYERAILGEVDKTSPEYRAFYQKICAGAAAQDVYKRQVSGCGRAWAESHSAITGKVSVTGVCRCRGETSLRQGLERVSAKTALQPGKGAIVKRTLFSTRIKNKKYKAVSYTHLIWA